MHEFGWFYALDCCNDCWPDLQLIKCMPCCVTQVFLQASCVVLEPLSLEVLQKITKERIIVDDFEILCHKFLRYKTCFIVNIMYVWIRVGSCPGRVLVGYNLFRQ